MTVSRWCPYCGQLILHDDKELTKMTEMSSALGACDYGFVFSGSGRFQTKQWFHMSCYQKEQEKYSGKGKK